MTEREEFESAFKGYNLVRSKSDSSKYGDKVSQRMWEAYQEGFKAAKTQVVPQWIPISERLPPVGELGSSNEYIVYETLNNKVQHDYFIITDDGYPPFWNYYDNHVTHWMPLPTVPEQQK